MSFKPLTLSLSVAPQLSEADVAEAAAQGFRSLISHRPDGEEPGQPSAADMRALAEAHGLAFAHVPAIPGQIGDADIAAMADTLASLPGPVLAFCRTGTRAATLWALTQAGKTPADTLLAATAAAGYDLEALRPRLQAAAEAPAPAQSPAHTPADTPPSARADIVIVGGGSAGLATAASLRARDKSLDIVIIEPKDTHYYQPGWTLVGGGAFSQAETLRDEAGLIPSGTRWIRGAVASFQPDRNQVTLADGSTIGYRALVVAPGNVLDWEGVDGLPQTLGKNGVTSNYGFETAPYTWELVQKLRGGTAIFTQPPMPIKCAGAPQKAMYLSCDHWRREGVLDQIDVQFHSAGAVIFGVKEFVPALMSYVERYGIDLNFESTLIAVDGPARRATFREKQGEVSRSFDVLHVSPPQKAPAFLANSPLADKAGYTDVDPATLQHVRHPNVFGLGDAGGMSNAKTMAAARKQAPVVAENLLAMLANKPLDAIYDGYGSCPLTVERGKVVLAEFGYGGKLLPSFPHWLIDPTRPQWLSWVLKARVLPWIYWHGMLKGHEWLARPEHRGA